jgi:hypothetical protein
MNAFATQSIKAEVSAETIGALINLSGRVLADIIKEMDQLIRHVVGASDASKGPTRF